MILLYVVSKEIVPLSIKSEKGKVEEDNHKESVYMFIVMKNSVHTESQFLFCTKFYDSKLSCILQKKALI